MRRATSIVLAVSFILVAVTGLTMALGGHHGPGGGPHGMRAGAGPGFGPPGGPGERVEPLFPKQIHEWGAYLMVLAGVVHIGLNWRVLVCYLGLQRRPCEEPVGGLQAERIGSG